MGPARFLQYTADRRVRPFFLNRMTQLFPDRLRVFLYRALGVGIGQSSVIRRRVFFDSPNLRIGNNVLINYG